MPTIVDAILATSFSQHDKELLIAAFENAQDDGDSTPTSPQPRQANQPFPAPGSGFVFLGTSGNRYWRFRVDDADVAFATPTAGGNIIYLEEYIIPNAGDVVINTAGAGVVIYGRNSGGLFRIQADDSDYPNRTLLVEKLLNESAINDDDEWFDNNYTFDVKGNTQQADLSYLRWQFFVDDTDAANGIPLTEYYSP